MRLARPLQITQEQAVGVKAELVFQFLPDLANLIQDRQEQKTSVTVYKSDQDLWYEVRLSPLLRGRGQLTGWLVVLLDITNQKQAEIELNNKANGLQIVSEVSAAIATTLDAENLIANIVDLMASRFNLYYTQIFLLDKTINALALAAGKGPVGQELVNQGYSIPLNKEPSLVAQAARTRQSVVSNDTQSDPGFLPNDFLPETRSELAVPMSVNEELLGILDVQSNQTGWFSTQEVHILTTLAAQAAVACPSRTISKARDATSPAASKYETVR